MAADGNVLRRERNDLARNIDLAVIVGRDGYPMAGLAAVDP
jgi:hypothetical protein